MVQMLRDVLVRVRIVHSYLNLNCQTTQRTPIVRYLTAVA